MLNSRDDYDANMQIELKEKGLDISDLLAISICFG